LVHLGNNPYHEWLLARIDGPRTVVVLHDLVLHHLLVESTVTAGRPADLEVGLRLAYAESGGALARAREVGLAGRRDGFLFPARRGLITRDPLGFVVHSEWARQVLEKEFPAVSCAVVGLPAADPGPVDRVETRARLGLTDSDLVVMHLGFLTPEKGMRVILAGVAAAATVGVPVRLVLVGEGRGLDDVRRAADAAGIGDRIHAAGWLPQEVFRAAPAAADLGVVLRTPTAGESSAAGVRFLACGTPVAVGGIRQFLEWPPLPAPRITPGPSAAADLARLLQQAAVDRAGWRQRRSAARALYEAHHRTDDYAVRLLEFLRFAAGRDLAE
jgi:glycosyltransferase involved in cell wall biosynthesis